jgi:pimeloyl-ACP methyl ester carboxylesterase
MRAGTIGLTFGRGTARRRVATLIAGGLALAGLLPAAGAIPVAAATGRDSAWSGRHGSSIRIGTLTLHRCGRGRLVYCGGLAVPLDYSSPARPHIHVGFRWLPATTGKHVRGTVLAVEGGPGYASAGTQAEYLAMMGSLVRTRNLLLVNLRGTGNSTVVRCPGLERYGRAQHQFGARFNKLVAQCGRTLNHTWRYRRGGWVHASDLFNTAYSARDVARVLTALRLGRVDLYGDSYGSWFAQVFASRYPKRLRSVALDSTYQVLGLDPWYTTTVVTARRAFAQACSRWPACARATHAHRAWARISALAGRLTRSPVTGTTVSEAGSRTRMTVTVETLVNLINNAGFDAVVYQDLDAAARALLRHHDSAPLLRLAALSIGFDDTNDTLPEFSDGLYFAVACTDYVQLFSRTAPPPVRASQYRAALRREPQHAFAPFTLAEWTRMDQYTEAYSACLHWPTPTRLITPIPRKPPLVPRTLPVLILSGTFDSLTPWLRGATLVARQMGRSARVVRVANLTHVTLQDGDDSCPASIYQRFVRHPGRLAQETTGCARNVAPVHTVGTYPRRLAAVTPATATAGNTADRRALRAAAAATASVGDEISRWPLLAGNRDRGLRGGRITFSGGHVIRISLNGDRWVTNATIDGTARWNQQTRSVTARLTVRMSGAAPVSVVAHWRVYARPHQLAVVSGREGTRHLAAVLPAP